ncbi:MAG TPA: hypothetical protein VFO16_01540 [Pseudonocardiaceae bacterium]|nr:hypothetical protein [Pseudonocardiaceae bacterium]
MSEGSRREDAGLPTPDDVQRWLDKVEIDASGNANQPPAGAGRPGQPASPVSDLDLVGHAIEWLDQHQVDPGADLQAVETAQEQPEQPADPRVPLLTTAQIRRLGALDGEDTRRAGDAQFLAEQAKAYRERSKDELIEELLVRDKTLLTEGRVMTDGRMAGNLLREFVRGILQTADTAELRRIEGFAREGKIQHILELLGAEPMSLRDLRLQGSALGNVNETRPGIDSQTYARPDVGGAITQHRSERVANQLNDLLGPASGTLDGRVNRGD